VHIRLGTQNDIGPQGLHVVGEQEELPVSKLISISAGEYISNGEQPGEFG
jgi:hypothetical protein